MMKLCFNCRRDLGDNEGVSIQCDKCKKNEEKYGKPERCKYCQLLAAFVDKKCVYCAYSQRKLGLPVACSKCGLKSAFTKNPDNPAFCRNCTANLKPEEKAKLKREAKVTTANIFAKKPKTSVTINSFPLTSGTTSQIQELRDQISDLRATVIQRDQTILEKDQQIAKLKSSLMLSDTEHRQALREIHKRNEVSQRSLQEQIRNLSRELDNARQKFR